MHTHTDTHTHTRMHTHTGTQTLIQVVSHNEHIVSQHTVTFLSHTGLSQVEDLGPQVFHAGTALKEGGGVVTSGGRVLTVTAVMPSLDSALHKANQGVAAVGFPGAVYRRDIGHRAIAYLTRSRCV